MSNRVTIADVTARVVNVNRRLEPVGRSVHVSHRYDYYALDEYLGSSLVRTLTAGTKREVAEFLHAMSVGIDLSRQGS